MSKTEILYIVEIILGCWATDYDLDAIADEIYDEQITFTSDKFWSVTAKPDFWAIAAKHERQL